MLNHFQKYFLIFLFLCTSSMYAMKRQYTDNNTVSTTTEWLKDEFNKLLKEATKDNFSQNYENIKQCIEYKADLNCKREKDGKTILMLTIKYGDQDLINFLLKQPHIDVNTCSNKGNNPLYYVLKRQYRNRNVFNKEVFEKLLMLGASPDGVEEFEAPLAHAISFRNVDCAELLIKYGADVNKKDYWGVFPLQRALEEGNPEIITILCDAGAFFEQVEVEHGGHTPFHFAISEKLSKKSIKILITHLYSKTRIDNVYNRVENIKKILQCKNALGQTALEWLYYWHPQYNDPYRREIESSLDPIKLQNAYEERKNKFPRILKEEPNNVICQMYKNVLKTLK